MNYEAILKTPGMIQNLLGRLPWLGTAGTVLTAIVAVCTLFWGYKLLKFWICLAGFAIGAILGAIAGIWLKAETPVLAGTVLAAGFIFACLAFFFYKMGIFLFVAVNGYGLVSTLLQGAVGNGNTWWIIGASVAAGIIAGILAVAFVRPVVILFTAFGGGSSLAFLLCPLLGIESYAVNLIAAVVLAVMGMLWQFGATSSGRHSD
ncbi:MAG: hypothetical protein MR308_09835 [Lachnospiraceae bacterium]|nr:hypothetical protein [Lachnospiraceae bacterium]